MKIPAETVEELRHEVSEGLVLVHNNFIVFVFFILELKRAGCDIKYAASFAKGPIHESRFQFITLIYTLLLHPLTHPNARGVNLYY